jgi:hypothetical protein
MGKVGSSNYIQGLALLFLFVNICLFLFIFAPPGHYNPSNVLSNTATEAVVTPKSTPQPSEDMVLEWRLVDTFNDGNWRVEKYREFEKHLDDKGKVVQEVPTSNFNYLRYWRYK